jgi:hypothetical protein
MRQRGIRPADVKDVLRHAQSRERQRNGNVRIRLTDERVDDHIAPGLRHLLDIVVVTDSNEETVITAWVDDARREAKIARENVFSHNLQTDPAFSMRDIIDPQLRERWEDRCNEED